MSARFVRWAHGGDVYEHVGNEGDTAVLRHPTITHNDPGGRLHGKPAEIRCPQAWLTPAGRPIPAAGPHAVVDAPAGSDLSPVPAGVSSPGSAGGTPVAVAVQPGLVAAVVSPSAAATPHRGARKTDPATSVEAAESITDMHRRADHDMVLHLLALHGPLTDFDLARLATAQVGHNVQQTSIGVRRSELRNAGLVCDSGFKGKTPSGARSIRWTLTAQGEQVAA